MSKPRILVTRAVFPETVDYLSRHFEVEANPSDEDWNGAQLAERLRDKDGAFTTGSVRIDAAVLEACPKLKICANMAVGYNNFDLDAMTARGVLGTNTPDVLTETTADFGFALLMATARRITESEIYLREGKWTKWSYDMFAGSDIHGATLGILGMGRIGQGIARRGSHGFGMNVIYHNRSRLDAATEAECKARYVSKEELFKAVVRENMVRHQTEGAEEIARFEGPTAALLQYLMLEWWRRYGATKASGISKLVMSEASNFPDLARFFQEEVVTPGHAMIRSVLQRGIERGEFRPVDMDLTVHSVLAPLLFLVTWKHSLAPCCPSSQQIDPETFIRHHTELLVRGLSV